MYWKCHETSIRCKKKKNWDRNDVFSSSMQMAKDLAHEMDIDAIFPEKGRVWWN